MAWREFRRSCHPNPPCDQHEYSRLIESLPEAWLITLRDAVLNRPRPIDWQECVRTSSRTSDLPGNAWTCMNDNGQGRRWVAPTQGEAPVFEWMETGELRATTQVARRDRSTEPRNGEGKRRGRMVRSGGMGGRWTILCERHTRGVGAGVAPSPGRKGGATETQEVGVRRTGDKGGPHAAGRHDQRRMGDCG